MKLLILLIATAFVVDATSDAILWTQFKNEYSKTYKNLIEDKIRFNIFQSNVRVIENHNAKYDKGEETYFMKINQFADLTDEEFEAMYLNYNDTEITNSEIFQLAPGDGAPDAIDWRDKGVVLPVKDQGHCGSCWAFSAAAAIEGQNAIKHGIKLDLSAEELVDCTLTNHGCEGGGIKRAFDYVRDHGISTDESYPYVASHGEVSTCRPKQSSGVVVHGYAVVPTTEEHLKQAVGTVGPISVSINGKEMKSYGGGVYNNPTCSQALSLGVLAVGYGTTSTQEYWIIKNSWGTKWGEEGYIRLIRNKDQQCGISLRNSYPLIA